MFGFNNWNFYKESRDGFAADAEGMMRVHHDRGEVAKAPGIPQGRHWPRHLLACSAPESCHVALATLRVSAPKHTQNLPVKIQLLNSNILLIYF